MQKEKKQLSITKKIGVGTKRRRTILFVSILLLIIAFLLAGYLYVSDYYSADSTCRDYLYTSNQVVVHQEKEWISFAPKEKSYQIGFIFYPGAKVEETSYAQLMSKIAEEGYLCILVKMPFRLAFFSPSHASTVIKSYPDIHHWYIGGHSLGGAMAADYAAHHSKMIHGLIMLGAYSASDLSDTKLSVLSIYGTKDKVLNHDKLKHSNAVMPYDFREYVIEGGNHSYYGNYGEQKGDGVATITRIQQITETVDQIVMFMK